MAEFRLDRSRDVIVAFLAIALILISCKENASEQPVEESNDFVKVTYVHNYADTLFVRLKGINASGAPFTALYSAHQASSVLSLTRCKNSLDLDVAANGNMAVFLMSDRTLRIVSKQGSSLSSKESDVRVSIPEDICSEIEDARVFLGERSIYVVNNGFIHLYSIKNTRWYSVGCLSQHLNLDNLSFYEFDNPDGRDGQSAVLSFNAGEFGSTTYKVQRSVDSLTICEIWPHLRNVSKICRVYDAVFILTALETFGVSSTALLLSKRDSVDTLYYSRCFDNTSPLNGDPRGLSLSSGSLIADIFVKDGRLYVLSRSGGIFVLMENGERRILKLISQVELPGDIITDVKLTTRQDTVVVYRSRDSRSGNDTILTLLKPTSRAGYKLRLP